MNPKRKTILLRWLRTLGATLLANVMVVATDPTALHYATAHWQQFASANLLIPTLVALEKLLRDGGAPDSSDGSSGDGTDPAA